MSKLTSINYIKQIMADHGIRFSKSLGQNFLTDDNIIDKICDSADIAPNDGVIEIGPGIGSLTEGLLNRAKKVVSIEIDKTLYPILDMHFSSAPHFKLVKADVLSLDLNALIQEEFADCERVKVVANLPYYITTPIIMHLLEQKISISDIVVMIQKEVADRLSADLGGKAYGALTVSAQFYADIEQCFKVPRGVFIPQPNVDSAVIRLQIRQTPPVALHSDDVFFKVVKAAFAQRRKTLLNTLSHNLKIDKPTITQTLESVGIAPSQRAEQLSIKDFGTIANALNEYM